MSTRELAALVAAEVTRQLDERAARDGRQASPEVMSVADAAKYIGKRSTSAFYRWASAWHVYPCAHGRYARVKLDLGLQREARGVHERVKCAA